MPYGIRKMCLPAQVLGKAAHFGSAAPGSHKGMAAVQHFLQGNVALFFGKQAEACIFGVEGRGFYHITQALHQKSLVIHDLPP